MLAKGLARWLWPLLAASSLGAASPDVRLVEAVKARDSLIVRRLLEQVDVNAPEVDGTTALHWAAHLDDLNTAQLLIGAGANVKAANRYGVTALSLACIAGNPVLIEKLLEAGADPNAALPAGETALMTAARTGNVDAVKVLLAHGANVNAKERWRGQTALMWAVAEKHPRVVRTLIDFDADVHARSNGGFTPLLLAVRAGDIDSVSTLLAAGARVNETAPDGTTLLVLAMLNAHYELAAFLLNQGADPDVDGPGGTALHAAVLAHKPVRANLPDPVPTGNLDSLGLIEALLTHAANPNARITMQPRDRNYLNLVGATPFLLAAKNADSSLMRLLVNNGADPSLTTKEKTTAMMLAAGIGYFEGESPGSEGDALEAVKLALELGGDVNAVDALGDTALHGAAVRGANAVVQFLVDKGAKLDATNQKGWTPLTIADGVFIARSYKAQTHTAALLRQLMSGEAAK